MTDHASEHLFEWLDNTPSVILVSPRSRRTPPAPEEPKELSSRERATERISERSSPTLRRRSRSRRDTARRRCNGVFRHRGSTYRPNYDFVPERRGSERRDHERRDHERRDHERTDRRHAQETRYRPSIEDQNTPRDVDVAHLHHAYEYHNAPRYSNYHSFTRDYYADSRDSHHYPSRYESRGAPRYSSDPAPVHQYPYYSESHSHFYDPPTATSQVPRGYRPPRRQDEQTHQNFASREEYDDRYYQYPVRTDTDAGYGARHPNNMRSQWYDNRGYPGHGTVNRVAEGHHRPPPPW